MREHLPLYGRLNSSLDTIKNLYDCYELVTIAYKRKLPGAREIIQWIEYLIFTWLARVQFLALHRVLQHLHGMIPEHKARNKVRYCGYGSKRKKIKISIKICC